MLDYQKKKQLGILVKIALVDEDFADEERAMIAKISETYGADQEEMEEIYHSSGINDSLAPMSVIDKMNFMMDCMLVVLADHVVTNSEQAFTRQMAINLGFNEDVVPFLIETKSLERKEMYDRLLPYLVQQ